MKVHKQMREQMIIVLNRVNCNYLLVSSADNLCKLFDTLILFLKEFFKRDDVEKNNSR